MPEDLFEVMTARTISGAKIVLHDDNFKLSALPDRVKEKFGPEEQEDLAKIHDLIKEGGDLAPYHRGSMDKHGDNLLVKHGVMHLHLGGKDSDCLLYLLQFPSHVVFLTIDTHIHLEDVPPGKKFSNGFQTRAARAVATALEEQEEEKKQRTPELDIALDKIRAAADLRKSLQE
jgi:hypothetical protein